MEKETYKVMMERHQKIIGRAKLEIEKIINLYIENNRQFNIGDKIKITRPEHAAWSLGRKKQEETFMVAESHKFAFVVGFEIDYNNDLKYLLKACKKDGEQSKNSEYYGNSDILTLCTA